MNIDRNVYCPRCNGLPKGVFSAGDAFTTYICYETCGFIYWTLRICPYCQEPQKTLLLNKPRFGDKVTCKSCKQSVFFFRCPNKNCKKFFFRDGNHYRMGEKISCFQCNFEYRTVACPCGSQVIIHKDDIIFEGFSANKCECCAKVLIYTICPTCKNPQYHIDQLQIGQKTRCSHCKVVRKYIPCPRCGISVKGQNFSFYEPTPCQLCQVYFEYCKCPYGCPSISYNTLTKPMGPHRTCYQCTKQYYVLNCKKCHNTLYQQTMTSGEAIIDNCPHCKQKIQFYLCPCGLFNSQETSCVNKKCPKPKMLTDNIKRNEAERKKNEKQKRSEERQCKVCFNQVSQYINEVCGHILMCEDCLKNYLKGKNTDRLPCPVCKTIGRYFKYKDPIYS